MKAISVLQFHAILCPTGRQQVRLEFKNDGDSLAKGGDAIFFC